MPLAMLSGVPCWPIRQRRKVYSLQKQLDGTKTAYSIINLIPGVVYTWPEVASVGATEEQLKKNGTAYKTGNFPYKALGRARASMDTDGFVKIFGG